MGALIILLRHPIAPRVLKLIPTLLGIHLPLVRLILCYTGIKINTHAIGEEASQPSVRLLPCYAGIKINTHATFDNTSAYLSDYLDYC